MGTAERSVEVQAGLVLALFGALRLLLPRKLAGISRALPMAGHLTLWGAEVGPLLAGLRAWAPPVLYALAAYDLLLLVARGTTRVLKELPKPLRYTPPDLVTVPGTPEGIAMDQKGYLVVTTLDGQVLRRVNQQWQPLGTRQHGKPPGIVPDPLGGCLLVRGGGGGPPGRMGAARWHRRAARRRPGGQFQLGGRIPHRPQVGARHAVAALPAHLAPASLVVRGQSVWFAAIGKMPDWRWLLGQTRGRHVGRFEFPPGP